MVSFRFSIVFSVCMVLAASSQRPQLNSVFVSLGVRPAWSPARWRALFADLTEIQVKNVILADAVTVGWDAATETEYRSWYPTSIKGYRYDGEDVLAMALEAAADAKITVFLGLLQPANWFHEGAMNSK
jgi:hypothetical protein